MIQTITRDELKAGLDAGTITAVDASLISPASGVLVGAGGIGCGGQSRSSGRSAARSRLSAAVDGAPAKADVAPSG